MTRTDFGTLPRAKVGKHTSTAASRADDVKRTNAVYREGPADDVKRLDAVFREGVITGLRHAASIVRTAAFLVLSIAVLGGVIVFGLWMFAMTFRG